MGGGAGAWLTSHGFTPWQAVFVLVGAPGLLLAALVAMTVREPARHETDIASVGETLPSLREVLAELFVRNRFCAPYFAAYVALITLFDHAVLLSRGLVSDTAHAAVPSRARRGRKNGRASLHDRRRDRRGSRGHAGRARYR